MLRIAVLVSGGGTNLQALIDAQNNGVLSSGRIVQVISSRSDAFALNRAEEAGIMSCVCVDEPKILEELKKCRAELVVLAGYMHILSRDFLTKCALPIVNVHPSLIPSFCGKGYYGLKVHEAALKAGVKVTGATVHMVNEIPDGGEILAQKAVEVVDGDTPETLQRRVMRLMDSSLHACGVQATEGGREGLCIYALSWPRNHHWDDSVWPEDVCVFHNGQELIKQSKSL